MNLPTLFRGVVVTVSAANILRKGIGSLPNYLRDCDASQVVQDFFSSHATRTHWTWLGLAYLPPSWVPQQLRLPLPEHSMDMSFVDGWQPPTTHEATRTTSWKPPFFNSWRCEAQPKKQRLLLWSSMHKMKHFLLSNWCRLFRLLYTVISCYIKYPSVVASIHTHLKKPHGFSYRQLRFLPGKINPVQVFILTRNESERRSSKNYLYKKKLMLNLFKGISEFIGVSPTKKKQGNFQPPVKKKT